MSDLGPRFDPSELAEAAGEPLRDAEAAGLLATARDLEEFARAETLMPSVGFENRVMAAVAAEAPPHIVVSGGLLRGLVEAVRDAWRISWSGGRPLAVRVQALAFVLLAVVTAGSAGSLAAVGAASLLSGDDATPTPTVDTRPPPISPSPLLRATPSPSPSVGPSPSPSASPEPSETPETSASEEPTSTSGSGPTQAPTRTPPPTARPTATPPSTNTPDPTETPDPSGTPQPTGTADPSDTPEPPQT